MYYNNNYNYNKYNVDFLDQMRGQTSPKVVRKDSQWRSSITSSWDQCPHLIQGVHQQQESPEETPAAAGRGAEGRIYGGERGRTVGTKWVAT